MSTNNVNDPQLQGQGLSAGNLTNPNTPANIGNAANERGTIGGATYGEYETNTPSLSNSASALEAISTGWSLKNSVLGQNVYNELGETVGKVEDVIITADTSASSAVIGVGGFLGMGTHDVAIPVKSFTITEGKIVLPGATKEALKDLPSFDFTNRYS